MRIGRRRSIVRRFLHQHNWILQMQRRRRRRRRRNWRRRNDDHFNYDATAATNWRRRRRRRNWMSSRISTQRRRRQQRSELCRCRWMFAAGGSAQFRLFSSVRQHAGIGPLRLSSRLRHWRGQKDLPRRGRMRHQREIRMRRRVRQYGRIGPLPMSTFRLPIGGEWFEKLRRSRRVPPGRQFRMLPSMRQSGRKRRMPMPFRLQIEIRSEIVQRYRRVRQGQWRMFSSVRQPQGQYEMLLPRGVPTVNWKWQIVRRNGRMWRRRNASQVHLFGRILRQHSGLLQMRLPWRLRHQFVSQQRSLHRRWWMCRCRDSSSVFQRLHQFARLLPMPMRRGIRERWKWNVRRHWRMPARSLRSVVHQFARFLRLWLPFGVSTDWRPVPRRGRMRQSISATLWRNLS